MMRKYSVIAMIFICILAQGCNLLSRRHKKSLNFFERITLERTNDDVMEEFIDSLLEEMSLTAKIGQMTQVNEVYFMSDPGTIQDTSGFNELLDTAKAASVIREFQVGSFLSGGKRSPEEWIFIISELQKLNLRYSENHIPFIFGIDHVHGANYVSNGTIFPHEINIAATFNPELAFQAGVFTAREAAPLGHHWNFAPILDVTRNKMWPRVYETYGEDTYLASVMGAEYIRGVQETRQGPYSMAACAKHFLGYSFTLSGWDRAPAEISPQGLLELQVPVFKSAVDAGVMSVMINSGEINGTPVHASYYYLTELLRDQLGFQGVAITDYRDIIKLHTEHFITANEKESTFTAIMAGIDMSMTPTTVDFCRYVKELVEEDRIPEERIDLSVRRILRLKYLVGLFSNPFPSGNYLTEIGSEEAKLASQKAAAESIVLMKNERSLLPLRRPKKIVITGMNANLKMALGGGWTYSWQGNEESLYPDSMKTVYGAIRSEFEDARVILSAENAIRWWSAEADAILIVTGEPPYAEGWGNIDDLALQESETRIIRTAIETKRPVILLLLEGRPRIIGDLFDQCQAVIFGGLPGMFGADAIAGVLSGRINPSGKMSITYPYQQGHVIPYNHKPMEYSSLNVYNKDIQRYTIAEFGTGLSYTSYEYSDLQLSDSIIRNGQQIKASVRVTNKGQREGYEAVLWFLTDEVRTFTPPVKQLKFFEKQFLLPGEVKDYQFTIDPEKDLSYPDETGKLLLEPGYFTLKVGNLSARFRYVGE
ncbi:MAG TPA: glycoside hydrolase family 3 N-terminal domain-containing protein [Cyclobacteriaceae bacterium]|nr:glycoside hydrolase family 3 N-terminal domain-containing protein [Cyclobacteriaceae bacterium]